MSLKFSTILLAIILLCFLLYRTGVHAEPPDFEKRKKSFEAFARQLAKKNGMKYLNIGVGTLVDSNVVAWDFSLTSDRAMTLDQARPMAVSMIQDFWQKVKQDPIFDKCLKIRHQQQKQCDPQLAPKRMGMKIAFWDQNVDRPLPPYLAQIKVKEGLIYYFLANPKDQSLQDPVIETFEEAFAKVKQPPLQ